MRNLVSSVALMMLSFVALTHAQQSSTPPAAKAGAGDSAGRLPVKRVVLYKNGVGYFEHSTRVQRHAGFEYRFHLRAIERRAEVADRRGPGRWAHHRRAVQLRGAALRALEDSALAAGRGRFARSDLLQALRGTRVEVQHGPATARARCWALKPDKQFGDKPELVEEVTVLTLVTDARRGAQLRPGAGHLRAHRRPRTGRRGESLPEPDRLRQGRRFAPPDHLRRGHGRARNLCQLHQRSAGVEEHLPHSAGRRSTAINRWCRAGRWWITPSARIGKTCSSRWWRARRSRLCRIFRSPCTSAGRKWRCRSRRC